MQALHQYTSALTRHQSVLVAGSQCSTSGSLPGLVCSISRSRQAGGLIVQAAVLDDAAGQGQIKWTYKYRRTPCPSPCRQGEQLCCEVEALVQNVLSFPNLPMRIYRVLPNIRADVNSMTALVEKMASHFGKELTLCYIRTQPRLLELNFDTVLERCESTKQVLNARDTDLPQLLRKCPELLLMDPQEVKQRFDNIPRVVQFSPMQVQTVAEVLFQVACLYLQHKAARGNERVCSIASSQPNAGARSIHRSEQQLVQVPGSEAPGNSTVHMQHICSCDIVKHQITMSTMREHSALHQPTYLPWLHCRCGSSS